MEIFQTDYFTGRYDNRCGALIQSKAVKAVRKIVRNCDADPKNFIQHHQEVTGSMVPNLREIKISSGDRMLVTWKAPCLLLVDVGNHEIVRRHPRATSKSQLSAVRPAYVEFLPPRRGQDTFFRDRISKAQDQLVADELTKNWVKYLDTQQAKVHSDIIELFRSTKNKRKVAFVVGGPGTGKTVILLNLLSCLGRMREVNVGLKVSPAVEEYLQACLPQVELAKYRWRKDLPYSVVLLDDPENAREIRSAVEIRLAGTRLLVVGFDPCQLNDSLNDAEYRDLVRTGSVAEFTLDSCYRNKRNVGLAVQEASTVIAKKTSAMAATNRVFAWRESFKHVNALASTAVFRNPSGYACKYPNATILHIQDEVRRVTRSHRWKHWPSLLVVVDDTPQEPCPPSWYDAVDPLKPKIVTVNEIPSIKGVEFQHVFLWLGRNKYQAIVEGQESLGKPEYFRVRNLRIPLSRGKDSLVLFCYGRSVSDSIHLAVQDTMARFTK